MQGIHKVRARLADGSRGEYHYAWRGGPRLMSDPGSHAYVAEWCKLTREQAETPEVAGTMSGLIRSYLKSPAFQDLSETTQRSYLSAIDKIEAEFCDLPIAAIDERGARRNFVEWRDGFSATPRTADVYMTVLALILAFAADREIIARNPLEKVKRLSKGTRRDMVWYDDQIEAFKAVASPALVFALQLAMWTGQRQGDLLRLTWSAYDGTHIRLRQGKTGRNVRIKVYDELKRILDSTKRQAVTILTTERGNRPWTSSGFRASWGKACTKAGVEGVTFHDLRGTYVTKARSVGASFAEIADVTGHSEREAEALMRRHYLAGDAVVERLEIENKKSRKV